MGYAEGKQMQIPSLLRPSLGPTARHGSLASDPHINPNISKGLKRSQVKSTLGSEQKQIPILSGKEHPQFMLTVHPQIKIKQI